MSAPEGEPPATDEQIEAVMVGPPRRLDGTVTLHEYDPSWPARYQAQAEIIRAGLGDIALSVEHIGSTSVSGLAAKPVIDIELVVPDSADEPSYVPALGAAGFRLMVREPDWHEHRALAKRREDGDDESVNLHVFTDGCLAPRRDVRFRDWLRSHDEDRERYERVKRGLAGRVWKYMQNYADAKTEVIDDIRRRCGEPPGRCARY